MFWTLNQHADSVRCMLTLLTLPCCYLLTLHVTSHTAGVHCGSGGRVSFSVLFLFVYQVVSRRTSANQTAATHLEDGQQKHPHMKPCFRRVVVGVTPLLMFYSVILKSNGFSWRDGDANLHSGVFHLHKNHVFTSLSRYF